MPSCLLCSFSTFVARYDNCSQRSKQRKQRNLARFRQTATATNRSAWRKLIIGRTWAGAEPGSGLSESVPVGPGRAGVGLKMARGPTRPRTPASQWRRPEIAIAPPLPSIAVTVPALQVRRGRRNHHRRLSITSMIPESPITRVPASQQPVMVSRRRPADPLGQSTLQLALCQNRRAASGSAPVSGPGIRRRVRIISGRRARLRVCAQLNGRRGPCLTRAFRQAAAGPKSPD